MAIQGPVVRWVADHRKHHKFSDRDGDPHSPWRYGNTVPALMKGLFYAHMGWLFDTEQTSQRQYAPDLLKDKDIVQMSRRLPVVRRSSSLTLPAVAGGLSRCRGRAPSPRSSGPRSCASACCTT